MLQEAREDLLLRRAVVGVSEVDERVLPDELLRLVTEHVAAGRRDVDAPAARVGARNDVAGSLGELAIKGLALANRALEGHVPVRLDHERLSLVGLERRPLAADDVLFTGRARHDVDIRLARDGARTQESLDRAPDDVVPVVSRGALESRVD